MIEIYYIKKPDKYNISIERHRELTHGMEIESMDIDPPRREEYRLVATIDEDWSLEEVYKNCQNTEITVNITSDRSMMVGDIIKKDDKMYRCDSLGFSEIEWCF